MTEWRVIPGFSRYSASSDGQVRRHTRMATRAPGLLAQLLSPDGYFRVNLTDDDGRTRHRLVHVLVAAAFLGPKPHGMLACHGPAGQRTNSISNLSYGTHKSNLGDDRRRDGTLPIGSRNGRARLTEQDVVLVLGLLNEGVLTHAQIGERFGVKATCIGRIALGKTWEHVPRAVQTTGDSL